MNTLPSSSLLNHASSTSNPYSSSGEVIPVPDIATIRYTLSQGLDAGWDIAIRRDGSGLKVDKPLWRNLGWGRENRPWAPPPAISGYQYQGERIQDDVATLTYVPSANQNTSGGASPHPIAGPDDDAWSNTFPHGSTNTLASTLQSRPAQSPEGVMYHHAQAVGAVVGIEPDGHVQHLGTGFLARSPYDSHVYVVTNEHVMSAGHESGRFSHYELWLGYEHPNGAPSERIDLSGQPATNAGLDYAMFRVKNGDRAKAEAFSPLRSDSLGSASVGKVIYMPNHANASVKGISYRDSHGNHTKILQATSDLGSKYPNQVFVHNAFNYPGTSGSPIIDSDSNKVVALNFGGIGLGRAVNMPTVWKDAQIKLVSQA